MSTQAIRRTMDRIGTAADILWKAVVWALIAGLFPAAVLADWTRNTAVTPNTITSPDGWVLKVTGSTQLTIPIDASVGLGSGVLDLSTPISDGSVIVSLADFSFRKAAVMTTNAIGELRLPTTLTNIGANAFQGLTALTNVVPLLPGSLLSVGDSAFYNVPIAGNLVLTNDNFRRVAYGSFRVTKVTSVTLGNSVTSIVDYAFNACPSLTNVVLSENLVNIGSYAFSGCANLTTVSPLFPGKVVSVGDNAFECGASSKLTGNLVLTNDSFKTLGNAAFRYAKLTSSTLGNGVTNIPSFAFGANTSMTNLVLSKSLVSIQGSAFAACTSLKSVTPFLPDTVKVFTSLAFSGCTNLTGDLRLMNANLAVVQQQVADRARITSVMLGGSVNSLATYAFDNNSAITQFWFCGGVPSIGTGCFRGLAAYKTRFYASPQQAGWDAFATTLLTSAETNAFQTTYPGEPLPVGTWTPAGASGKQWLLRWQSPLDPKSRGAVIIVR